ncbi:hypothetical protein BR93DRAFT_937817 [Coniochaeta sp. PMI_546]|nr:hypothetical protein BR93DRAFT_937817 [Coniochaeta sp. PMI_546]
MSTSQSNPSAGQGSAASNRYIALCPFYQYSRCSYTKEIIDESTQSILEWKQHIRNHYPKDPEDIPFALHCWIDSCPSSHVTEAFFSSTPKVLDLHDNFNYLLDHVLDHFRNEPRLSRDDLRKDDDEMLVTAWHEVWDAYHNPKVPEKHTERLPEEVYNDLCRRLEVAGYSSKLRDLTELRERRYW